MIESSAPGKLMFSGEWSVLELDIPCIVLAVDKRVHCKFSESTKITLTAKDIGLEEKQAVFKNEKLSWDNISENEKEKILISNSAIETTYKYLISKGIQIKPFKVEIESEISTITLPDGRIEKIGFGSSAAATVALVTGLLAFHSQDVKEKKSKEIIYKISAMAHYLAQGKLGSSFDIAASVFGGVLKYTKFDAKKVIGWVEKGEKIVDIIEKNWPNLTFKEIYLPRGFILCVAYTGKGASTKELILKIREFKEKNSKKYWEIINSIKEITLKLETAIENNNKKEILLSIRKNRQLLRELSDNSGIELEVEKLKELSDLAEKIGCAGKFSGAGGGDNGIAVCFEAEMALKLKENWKDKGLMPLDVKVSIDGAKFR